MESVAVFPAVPRRTGRRIGRWILTGLEKIMMLLGILVTTGLTLTATVTTGWALETWWTAAESLPVVDGGGHSGRSAETALVIEATTEQESISAEYDWLSLHRPLDGITGERMESEGSFVYHVLEVNTWNGRPNEIWFDITQPYGHK
jgi:hypothetical protein